MEHEGVHKIAAQLGLANILYFVFFLGGGGGGVHKRKTRIERTDKPVNIFCRYYNKSYNIVFYLDLGKCK